MTVLRISMLAAALVALALPYRTVLAQAAVEPAGVGSGASASAPSRLYILGESRPVFLPGTHTYDADTGHLFGQREWMAEHFREFSDDPGMAKRIAAMDPERFGAEDAESDLWFNVHFFDYIESRVATVGLYEVRNGARFSKLYELHTSDLEIANLSDAGLGTDPMFTVDGDRRLLTGKFLLVTPSGARRIVAITSSEPLRGEVESYFLHGTVTPVIPRPQDPPAR